MIDELAELTTHIRNVKDNMVELNEQLAQTQTKDEEIIGVL